MEQLISLVEATALDPEDREFMAMSDLTFDLKTRESTALAWMWLRGLDEGSDPEVVQGVRHEVLSDAGLFVALNLPAHEFLNWFRLEDWSCFEPGVLSTDQAWAWNLLGRAIPATFAMGAMGVQCALRRPMYALPTRLALKGAGVAPFFCLCGC